MRPAWAEIDLEAVGHNAALLARLVAPAQLCAVVKANAYGHGAVEVARAALAGGARRLAVALVDEGVELREAGIQAPVLVLSDLPAGSAEAVADFSLTPTASCPGELGPLATAARRRGEPTRVHVKVDTGMHRVGAAPADVPALWSAAAGAEGLVPEGLWTHLAVADGGADDDRAFTAGQLARFDEVAAEVAAGGTAPTLRHAANSAGAISWPASRYDLVRCGLSLYGVLPSARVEEDFAAAAAGVGLRPVMSLRARVASVRELDAGERPSYGRLRALQERSVVATVPLGYADGLPRALFAAGYSVLIGGKRRPLAGAVTMDQILVDCGPGADVSVGDEVTLLGRQGGEEITATEWAAKLSVIPYEVLCGIGPRVPRITSSAGPGKGADPEEAAG